MAIVGSSAFLTGCLPDVKTAYRTTRNNDEIVDLSRVRSIASLTKPNIVTVAGFAAAQAKDKLNPPTTPFVIANLEIQNYEPNAPPIIKVFDEQSSKLLSTTKFTPILDIVEPPINLKIPLCLVYDKTPFDNPNKEPEARISRIELHMPVLNYIETTYVKLFDKQRNWGIFVVPVYWHNITEKGKPLYMNNKDVIDLFWTRPASLTDYKDVNTIWAQAGFQFHLLNTSVPFNYRAIPNHVLDTPHKSEVHSSGPPPWLYQYTDVKAVDVFTVYRITAFSDPYAEGWGGGYGQGSVYLKAGYPYSKNPGLSGLNSQIYGKAMLVAHEFGHYLGHPGHSSGPYDNLMLKGGGGGPKLEESQIQMIRIHVKGLQSFNEKK